MAYLGHRHRHRIAIPTVLSYPLVHVVHTVGNGTLYICQGEYDYYHYMQDRFDDKVGFQMLLHPRSHQYARASTLVVRAVQWSACLVDVA